MALNLTELEQLYFDGTKHSRYQNIPEFVQKALGYTVEIDEKWRGDTARYANLLHNLDFEAIRIMGDIGANTGFFALSIGQRFPQINVTAYEANANHSAFILNIVHQFGLNNIQVHNLSVDLQGIESLGQHDCLLNYNVLHHAGVDFDKGLATIETFAQYAEDYLGRLANKTKLMIFQMGFHWGGDKKKPIVHVNNDTGKVLFMSEIFHKSNWKIDKIFTVRPPAIFNYFEMDKEIIEALNEHAQSAEAMIKEFYAKYDLSGFSEFYRRPIFYCRTA